jgi:hypothetical protein
VSELLAVGVLLEPDAATKKLAAELNDELRRRLPAGVGFAFDGTHLPHVTLVQRYVRRDDLERLLEVVAKTTVRATGAEAEGLRLRAGGLGGGELGTPPGTVLASVEFGPQPAVRALHDAILRALTPIAATGGDSASAFFTLPGEPPPNAATVVYVEEFAPAHSGENYTPHLTAGVAREDDLRRLAPDHPLSGARVTPVAVAVAHLGDLGTARKILGRWPLV